MKLHWPWNRVREDNGQPPIAPVQQPDDMDDEARQIVRAAAAMEIETVGSLRDVMINQLITSARWVQTSLLR